VAEHLWARGYWVVTSGNVTDEMWADYIKNQTPSSIPSFSGGLE
jgi:REP element-mobilizing transposase RayT